ncbi:TPA: hypothetical protein MWR99_005387, partial [Klebsiella pneumoniae]|nr:hypothetical protein [Klebsiella pneumoniae]
MSNKPESIRELECKFDDNGSPSWDSFPSHKNCQVRGGCDLPPHLPGIIILVHGVNSTGEWFSVAEKKLCEGLNKRLGLTGTSYELETNKYLFDDKIDAVPLMSRDLPDVNINKSPVIRFYWGYASSKGNEDRYIIPLANKKGVDYHQLKRENMP